MLVLGLIWANNLITLHILGSHRKSKGWLKVLSWFLCSQNQGKSMVVPLKRVLREIYIERERERKRLDREGSLEKIQSIILFFNFTMEKELCVVNRCFNAFRFWGWVRIFHCYMVKLTMFIPNDISWDETISTNVSLNGRQGLNEYICTFAART